MKEKNNNKTRHLVELLLCQSTMQGNGQLGASRGGWEDGFNLCLVYN